MAAPTCQRPRPEIAGTGTAGTETADERWRRHRLMEASHAPVVALPIRYADRDHVAEHSHGRAQLLHALTGVVTVTTRAGRWMVPPDHALWIPAGMRHAVDMAGAVQMYCAYVRPQAVAGLPRHLHVAGLTGLMRCLILEAAALDGQPPHARGRAIMDCLLHEIPRLPERPLGLPFPSSPRLAALCRAFLAAPSPHIDIDRWARALGTSRRSFTRTFRRETGIGLSTWRRQACLMAALPRLAAGEAVTSVALDLGYGSVPAFTTMFKRALGAPPRAYLGQAGPAGAADTAWRACASIGTD